MDFLCNESILLRIPTLVEDLTSFNSLGDRESIFAFRYNLVPEADIQRLLKRRCGKSVMFDGEGTVRLAEGWRMKCALFKDTDGDYHCPEMIYADLHHDELGVVRVRPAKMHIATGDSLCAQTRYAIDHLFITNPDLFEAHDPWDQ